MTSALATPPVELVPYRVQLTGKHGRGKVALIDWADVPLAFPYRWRADAKGYVYRGEALSLHREVLGITKGDARCVDHINRNPLDNRRANLRFVTRGENMQNQGARGESPRGVRQYHNGYWVAHVNHDGRKKTIGYYDSEADADLAVKIYRAKHLPFSEEARDPHLVDATPPQSRKVTKTSTYKGVCWDSAGNRWRAFVWTDKRRIILGSFATEEAAAAAVQKFRESQQNHPTLPRPSGASVAGAGVSPPTRDEVLE